MPSPHRSVFNNNNNNHSYYKTAKNRNGLCQRLAYKEAEDLLKDILEA